MTTYEVILGDEVKENEKNGTTPIGSPPQDHNEANLNDFDNKSIIENTDFINEDHEFESESKQKK